MDPLAGRLRLLDLSHNVGIVWDEGNWMYLLRSLKSLRHLDIRSTGERGVGEERRGELG